MESWNKPSIINMKIPSYFFSYLKRTLAVVVLHFLVSSTGKQHSGTVILERREGKNYKVKQRKILWDIMGTLNFPTLIRGKRRISFLVFQRSKNKSHRKWAAGLNVWTCQHWLRGKSEHQNIYLYQEWSLAYCQVWICCSTQRERRSEGERDRQNRERKRREMERAEGFESIAQIAHKVLNHACTVHTHGHKYFCRCTISCWELRLSRAHTHTHTETPACSVQ